MYGLRKALAANDAFKRFYFCVRAKVLVEASLLCKSLWTEGAGERSHAGVHTHVLLQPALLSESLGADGALVRLGLGVHGASVLLVGEAIEKSLSAGTAWEG